MGDQYTTLTRMALLALAGLFVSIQPSRADDDCITKPNATAPPGNHWYYRVDRTTHRECWYLGPEGREVRTHAPPDGSPARSHPSNTMSAQPASQTPTPTEKAEAPGAGPLAAEPVLVEIAPGQTKTAEATRVGSLAAEPVPVDTAPSQTKTVAAAAPLEPPDEITPSQMTEVNSTANAPRWSAIPTSNPSIDPTFVSTRDGYAEEQSEDEPKPAELSTAQRPSEFPISLTQLSAVFAIWLGLAALIVPVLVRLSGTRKRAHQKTHDQQDTSTRRGIRRKAAKAILTPRDPALDFESNVRQLLQEFQWRQRCGISNAIARAPAIRRNETLWNFRPLITPT